MEIDIERFWRQVDKSGECWLWTGATRGDHGRKYGVMKIRQVGYGAHRISFQIANGPIPPGLCVLHQCDVPLCVNPDHLFLGTLAENNADRARKKRSAPVYGENNGHSILTDEKVLLIRDRAAAGESHIAMAREFGVARSLIGMVARGEVWAHAGGPRTEMILPRSNSGYRGVSWEKRRQIFQVYIDHQGKRITLGRTHDPVEGARMYDAKARELGVPEKRLNFRQSVDCHS